MSAPTRHTSAVRPAPAITVAPEPITAEFALAALEGRMANRRIKESKVESYARDMADGRWNPHTVEPIKFNVEGQLIDGEHRLRARMLVNNDVVMWVARNVPSEAREALDQGKARSLGDILALRGYTHPSEISRGIGLLYKFLTQRVPLGTGGNQDASIPELLNLLEAHPDFVASAEEAARLKRSGVALPTSVIALCHYLFNMADSINNKDFWEGLQSGAELHENSPILTLRNQLLNNAKARGANKQRTGILLAWVIKAWNAYMSGDTLGKIRFQPFDTGRRKAEVFPYHIALLDLTEEWIGV